jgi:predicted porin
MKKSLIALAVAGAFAAPAQAVEVNGAMAVGLDFSSVSAGSTAGASSISTHGLNAGYSNISLSHSEDVGDGMKVDVFLQAEWKPNRASGASDPNLGGNGAGSGFLVNRNSYIGVSGSFGAIRLGANENAYERMLYSHNYMDGDWSYGNIGIMGGTGGNGTSTVWNRTSDTIMYYSPNMNGLSFEIDYVTPSAAKTSGPNSVSPNIISAALEFAPAEGNFRAYAALHNSSDQNGPNSDESNMLIGGGMTMGNIKWDVIFETMKSNSGVAGASDIKHSAIDLEGQIGLPTGNLGLSFVKAQKTKGRPVTNDNTGATSISGEYMHNLGKSSWLFLVVSTIRNENNANYNLAAFTGTIPAGTGNGRDYTNFVVGLKHAF